MNVNKLFFGIFGAVAIFFVLWVFSGIVIFYIRRWKREKEIAKREAATKIQYVRDSWEKQFEDLNK